MEMTTTTTPTTTTTNASATPRRLLTAVLVLQGLTLLGQWTGQPGAATPAVAGIPDPGAQREEPLNELKDINTNLQTTNASLQTLIELLESGRAQVTVAGDDEGGEVVEDD